RLFAKVDVLLFLELLRDIVDQLFVEVVPAEVRVAVGGENFHGAFFHFQNGDVKGSAPEVEDDDLFVLLFLKTISQRGGGWLVDDTANVETGDLTCIFSGLPLRVVEIRRHSNDSLVD